jgi:catechol 2,3-dioxygenase-like lactoylglutathione lyase family enzyme
MSAPDGRPPFRVTSLDHIVLYAADVEASVAWYRDVLGLEIERLEEWRRGELPFPSARVDATTIIDLLGHPVGPGNVDHFALVVEGTTADELAASGAFTIEDGPADRSGARGTGRSIYVRDPAGILVELRSYPVAADGPPPGPVTAIDPEL